MLPSTVVGAFVVTLLAIARADAGTLVVAANGTDGSACGTKSEPCRSISRAIANARAGDTIDVGPGRYGDVDSNGSFLDPGDEAAQIGTGCNCLVLVPAGKPLVVLSRLGANGTLIDAGAALIEVVQIDAVGTTFGRPRRGFTLTGSGNARGVDSGANDIAVGGNIAVSNGSHGFRFSGDRTVVVGNRAIGNSASGFQLDGANGVVVRDNAAIANGVDGFNQVNAGFLKGNVATANGNDGFDQQGGDVTYQGNAAIGNGGIGFDLNTEDRTVLTGNVVQGNLIGVQFGGDDVLIVKSAIVANRSTGIVIEGGSRHTITKSNVFGNDTISDGSEQNCGITAANPGPLTATKNFWGAPEGPGADPADDVCLLMVTAPPIIDPPATKEIGIKAPR